MMSLKTLREACQAAGITRRALQGYEAAGLVSPGSRNERGHLLYDNGAVETMRRIKLYQEMGFSVKEIKQIQNLPMMEKKAVLIDQKERLQKEKEKISCLIQTLQEMIDQM